MAAADGSAAINGVQQAEGVTTKESAWSVVETVDRLRRLVEARAMKVFALIDHDGEAARVGPRLPETKVVIFGSPGAGTPVMLGG